MITRFSWTIWASVLLLVLPSRFFADRHAWTLDELPAAVETLKKASGRELEKEAIWIASSGETEALETLLTYLRDPDFLNRLRTAKRVGEAETYLRTLRILQAIVRNEGSGAERVLLELSNAKNFTKDSWRERALIDAAGYVPGASEKLLNYLDSQSDYHFRVLEALARLGSERAAQLAEKRYLAKDDLHRFYDVIAFIPGRNSPAIVNLYERLISRDYKFPATKDRLVQTLFEYRDTRWYETETAIGTRFADPPPRANASTEVLQHLLKIADQVVKMKLSDETNQGVKTARKEVEEILARRLPKK